MWIPNWMLKWILLLAYIPGRCPINPLIIITNYRMLFWKWLKRLVGLDRVRLICEHVTTTICMFPMNLLHWQLYEYLSLNTHLEWLSSS